VSDGDLARLPDDYLGSGEPDGSAPSWERGVSADRRRGQWAVHRPVIGAPALAEMARRNKEAELAEAAEMAAEAAASGFDAGIMLDPSGVRPLHQLRPVPLLVSKADRAVAPARPVYDPFSARRRRTPQWLVQYTAGLVVGDVAALASAALLTMGLTGAAAPGAGAVLALVAMWPGIVALSGGYAERRLGTGSDEYRRVLVAGLVGVSALSFVTMAFSALFLQSLVLLTMPVTILLTVIVRVLLRRRLHVARRGGAMTKQVVVVGREVAVVDLVRRLRRDATAGLTVIGACVPQPALAHLLAREGVPVLGGMDDAVAALERVRADAVLVASASETASKYLRDLSWGLEGTNIEVLVAPGMVEVAPERLQVRPTTTFPMIQVREPEFRGLRRVVKSGFDRSFAACLLVLGAPVFLLIALAVRCTSRGPVFYRHRRVGMRGQEFDLLKFRSMVVDADQRMDALRAMNEGNDVQFKMRRDPRVTRVGRFLRRSSLDELPQLINVLKGDMSVVGPRPHVTREVEQYGADMHRRLLVKPGITGLWQVSGRSNLAWEESVELDVRYVENWSLALDLTILQRTVGAVLRGSGAY
jgi:exopolysaccharide biosynthesis polyprenyl glycosylphosphotransferase